jgi:hypothetical protein
VVNFSSSLRINPQTTQEIMPVLLCPHVISFLAIWGAMHGHGPFTGPDPARNVMSLQVFLIFAAIFNGPYLMFLGKLRTTPNFGRPLCQFLCQFFALSDDG